jgi:hypothetical protein
MEWPVEAMPDRLRVPLFPLPNVVLFPGAVLPLHIFEPRYKRMTSDVLDGDGRIAMALLRPGWEPHYYGRPEIEPVVCVGRVVAHERLPDGNYNLLLQGQWRATVSEETVAGGDTPYRLARAKPMAQTQVMEIDLARERERLVQLFDGRRFAANGLGKQFARLLGSPMPTDNLADLLAFNYLDDLQLKQSLLAEGDTCARVAKIVAEMEKVASAQPPAPPSPPSEEDPGASLN